MSTYRLSLDPKNGLALVCGFLLLVALVFSSGVIVGFTAQPPAVAAAPAAVPAPAAMPAVLTATTDCPVAPAQLTVAWAEAEKREPVVSREEAPLPRPDIVPRSEAEPELDPAPNRYSVQIGAFRQASNAQNMIALLRKRGYEPVVVPERVKGEVLRSVRIADQAEWNRAWSVAKEFTAREQMDAMVVLAQQ